MTSYTKEQVRQAIDAVQNNSTDPRLIAICEWAYLQLKAKCHQDPGGYRMDRVERSVCTWKSQGYIKDEEVRRCWERSAWS